MLESVDNSGKELKSFVDEYLKFILDLTRYSLFKDMSLTKLPLYLEEKVKFAVSFENNISAFNLISNELLELKNLIRFDDSYNLTIKAFFIRILNKVDALWKRS